MASIDSTMATESSVLSSLNSSGFIELERLSYSNRKLQSSHSAQIVRRVHPRFNDREHHGFGTIHQVKTE